jgi:Outer membrane cobalamin receptor protein
VQEFDTSSLKYRSSAGTGFRAPSIGEVGLNRSRDERIGVQSTALHEERSQGWDFGVDLYTDGGNGIQATLFYQVVSDQLYFYYDPDTGGHYRQDSGDSKSKGIELTGDYHIYPWLNLRSNYTYNIARDTDDKPRLRRPKHMANMGLEFSLLDSKLTLLSNLRLVQSTKDVGDVDLDNYGVVDLSGTYKTERLTYFARIENVLDRDYVEVSDYNVSGRAAYAGVKYRF